MRGDREPIMSNPRKRITLQVVGLMITGLLMGQAQYVWAQSLKPQVERIVDHYAKPLVNPGGKPSQTQAPGGIVGVYINGETFYFPFGRRDDEGNPPTPDTIFGIGSVTKTFTTSILGQREKLFKESVTAGALPSGYKLQPEEAPVDFEQLATFTGGIVPSVPDCGCPDQKKQPACTQKIFVDFINSRKPKDGKLPTPDVYSNSSIGFIGQILMYRDHYEDFDAPAATRWFGEHLFPYLGMEHTSHPPKTDPEHPLSVAYGFRGGKYVRVDYACWVPWGTAGRVFSTADDMVRFIMANVGVSTIDGKKVPEEVLEGMKQALKPRTVLKGSMRQAFAWDVWPEDEPTHSTIRGKAGGIDGVSAYVSVNPELQYGVVVLLNMKGIKTQTPTIGIMKELRDLAKKDQ